MKKWLAKKLKKIKTMSKSKQFWLIVLGVSAVVVAIVSMLLIFQADRMKYVILLILFLLFCFFVYKVYRLRKVFPNIYPTLYFEIVEDGQKKYRKVKMEKDSMSFGRSGRHCDYHLNYRCVSQQQFWIIRNPQLTPHKTFEYTLEDLSTGRTRYIDTDKGNHIEVFRKPKVLQEDEKKNQFIIGDESGNYIKLKVCLPV